MSLLTAAQQKNPELGFAPDFVIHALGPYLRDIKDKGETFISCKKLKFTLQDNIFFVLYHFLLLSTKMTAGMYNSNLIDSFRWQLFCVFHFSGIRVISNAGGINTNSCVAALKMACAKAGTNVFVTIKSNKLLCRYWLIGCFFILKIVPNICLSCLIIFFNRHWLEDRSSEWRQPLPNPRSTSCQRSRSSAGNGNGRTFA